MSKIIDLNGLKDSDWIQVKELLIKCNTMQLDAVIAMFETEKQKRQHLEASLIKNRTNVRVDYKWMPTRL
jgi:hypothetical protein